MVVSLRTFLTALSSLCLVAFASAALAPRSVVERLELDDLVDRADVAVHAEVLSKRSFRNEHGWVVTEVELRVAETLWGETRERRKITLPGGVLPDGSGTVIPGMPAIEVGERALLFLSPVGSKGFSVPLGLSQGKFAERVDAEGRVQFERVHGKLQHVDPASGQLATLEPRELFAKDALLGELRRLASARRDREAEERAGEAR